MTNKLRPEPEPQREYSEAEYNMWRLGWKAFVEGRPGQVHLSGPNKNAPGVLLPSLSPAEVERVVARLRMAWYDGYYSAHVDHYVGPVLRKYGLA